MSKPTQIERKVKRAARERFLRQVRLVRKLLPPAVLEELAVLSRASDDESRSVENLKAAAKSEAALSNASAKKLVLSSMAAIEATLDKNPSDHVLQAFYSPTYHALRVELDRLINLELSQSEASYAPEGEITRATSQLEALAERVKANTDKLNLASNVLGAITKLISALGG